MTPDQRRAAAAALDAARAICGGNAGLARYIKRITRKKISSQAIQGWSVVPPARVNVVVAAVAAAMAEGAKVSHHTLRPDLHPADAK